MVFSLRNPVDRFVSAFRYGKQIGAISSDIPFPLFVAEQFNTHAVDPNRVCALSMGCYARFIIPYINHFGRDRICVVLSETLKVDPQQVLDQICLFVGIPKAQLAVRLPASENITRDQRAIPFPRQWNAARFALSRWTYRRPALHAGCRTLKHGMERLLTAHRPPTSFSPDPESIERLRNFYREEPKRLRALGVEVTWSL
jgi:hypothetical protein